MNIISVRLLILMDTVISGKQNSIVWFLLLISDIYRLPSPKEDGKVNDAS